MALYRSVSVASRILRGRVVPLTSVSKFYQAISPKVPQSILGQQRVFANAAVNYLQFARRFSSYPPHNVVSLPNLSPTMETGNVVSWAKNEGDKVAEGDLLAEIETDKATMAMDASEDGYVAKILIPAGSKGVPVGAPLVVIVESEDSIAAFKDYKFGTTPASAPPPPPAAPAAPAPPPPPTAPTAVAASPKPAAVRPAASGNRVFISPLARRVALERGIDLSKLSGTGSGVDGCFVLADLDNISVGTADSAPYTDIPLTPMRATIAKRLTMSKQTIPHFYLTVDVELDSVMRMREDLNRVVSSQTAKEEKPSKISINDIFIKAIAHSSKCVPECNSAWMGDFIRRYASVDVCVAVATPTGLITPIVFNADAKGLLTISQEVRALAARARLNKLRPEEFQTGTITISNMGMLGISNFSAIINPPQACILAVGASREVLLPDGDKGHKTATVVSVTLCCDHRVVDGAVGATWLKEFKSYLENPTRMLL